MTNLVIRHGIAWIVRPDGLEQSATPGECASEIERLRVGIQDALDNIYSHDVFQNLADLIRQPDEPSDNV